MPEPRPLLFGVASHPFCSCPACLSFTEKTKNENNANAYATMAQRKLGFSTKKHHENTMRIWGSGGRAAPNEHRRHAPGGGEEGVCRRPRDGNRYWHMCGHWLQLVVRVSTLTFCRQPTPLPLRCHSAACGTRPLPRRRSLCGGVGGNFNKCELHIQKDCVSKMKRGGGGIKWRKKSPHPPNHRMADDPRWPPRAWMGPRVAGRGRRPGGRAPGLGSTGTGPAPRASPAAGALQPSLRARPHSRTSSKPTLETSTCNCLKN